MGPVITNISRWESNHKCVGAEFSHSMLPVVHSEWLAVFSCLANESAQSVSPPATSDSRSGRPGHTWAILSSPLTIPPAANRDAACHSWADLITDVASCGSLAYGSWKWNSSNGRGIHEMCIQPLPTTKLTRRPLSILCRSDKSGGRKQASFNCHLSFTVLMSRVAVIFSFRE